MNIQRSLSQNFHLLIYEFIVVCEQRNKVHEPFLIMLIIQKLLFVFSILLLKIFPLKIRIKEIFFHKIAEKSGDSAAAGFSFLRRRINESARLSGREQQRDTLVIFLTTGGQTVQIQLVFCNLLSWIKTLTLKS